MRRLGRVSETRRQRIRRSATNPMIRTGRHFLQISGPTNVPDRVLRAISRPTLIIVAPNLRKWQRKSWRLCVQFSKQIPAW